MTNLTNQIHASVYIPSLEAAQLWEHNHRGRELYLNHVGMIPTSLELEKLIKVGFKPFRSKLSEKWMSNDIINVKFKQKVKSADETIKYLQDKIKKVEDKQLIEKWEQAIEEIEQEKHLDMWRGVKNDDLRIGLYADGFTYQGEQFVMYKRSSAKSRVGNCLFIRKKLYNKMIKWSNMGLNMKKHKVDVPSLLAYQSLVTSSIESVVQINPKNILLIDDVDSKFNIDANVVRQGDNGFLGSFPENIEIANSIWDGQSLLQADYFPDNAHMMLLRNHMFKSAAFRCDIKLYLMDYAKANNIDFDTWELKDMLGNTIMGRDVHMITTPNSLKALKFSHVVGTSNDMWNHWIKVVEDDGSLFGICKHEKPSKFDDVQRMSYQMINSLPGAEQDDIKDLAGYEYDYIDKLKNDDDFFVQYLEETANEMNSHKMLSAIYKQNSDIVNTKQFRDFRKDEISDYVKKVKSGKVRVEGDYVVLLSCPIEMLKSAVGDFNVNTDKPTLTGNQIYTKLFDFDQELVSFRNPHTSPSNILLSINTYNKEIDTYFPNLGKRIVVINTIKHEILDVLSGADMDSDSMLISNHPTLKKLAKEYDGKYRVCINRVESDKKQYEYKNSSMAEIDNVLGSSSKMIGQIVNLGQQYLSTYWDKLSKGTNDDKLMEAVDVLTICSGISIDLAKKKYEINFDDELDNIKSKSKLGSLKPKFWKHLSSKAKVTDYNCPMDYLQKVKFPSVINRKDNMDLGELLVKRNANKGDRKQREKMINEVTEMDKKLAGVFSKITKDMCDDDKDEKYREIDDIADEYRGQVKKRKVKAETMYSILMMISKAEEGSPISRISMRLMNILYQSHEEVFLCSFSRKNSTI